MAKAARPRRLETLTEALKRQRRRLCIDHTLDFSQAVSFDNVDGLACLGTQRALETLILDGCPLTSLHTLPPQPRLKVLRADNSKVESLSGLRQVRPHDSSLETETFQSLSDISMIGAPVSAHETFRLSALILLPKLSKINKRTVTSVERETAKAYPPIAKALIAAGWMAVYPPPSDADFRYLANQFEITCGDKDFVVMAPLPQGHPYSPPASPGQAGRLSQRIAGILRPLGFAIRNGPTLNDDIVGAVDTICRVVEKLEQMADSSVPPDEWNEHDTTSE
jgi:hypothetical protein